MGRWGDRPTAGTRKWEDEIHSRFYKATEGVDRACREAEDLEHTERVSGSLPAKTEERYFLLKDTCIRGRRIGRDFFRERVYARKEKMAERMERMVKNLPAPALDWWDMEPPWPRRKKRR